MAEQAVTASEDALALLDQWAEGELPDSALQSQPAALSQHQMRQLWEIMANPGRKQTLDAPISIPR